MNTPFQIIGFSSTDFVPGFVGQVTYGAGPLSAGDQTITLLLVGNKTSAGSMTANQDVSACFSETEADALVGPGSEQARQAYAALQIPGVQIWLAPVSDPGGTAASIIITLATTATSAGVFDYYIGGRLVSLPVALGDTATVAGALLADLINANTRLPCTAADTTGAVTLTMKQTGPRGNDVFVRQVQTGKPGAMTSTLSTGTAVTGVGMKFASGATADDLTTVATNTFAGWYNRVGLAARDATQLGVWETSMDSKAGPLEGRPQHTVCASNAALATVQSLTQTTLNNARFQMLWLLNGENDPAEVGATMAAIRCVTEQGDPGASYDDVVLPGVAPQFLSSNIPQRSTLVAALQTGVTPLTSTKTEVKVVRSITTRCLNGANPDYRTLDTGYAYVPDFIRYDIGLQWNSVFRVANPVVDDDIDPALGDRPSGVATPKRWNQFVYARLKEHERGDTVASNIPQIIDVELNLPASVFEADPANRIMSAIPCKPSRRQHQIGVTVLQL